MKVLKYIGIAFAALLVIFFGAGLMTSEIAYESEVVINKPVEEVWAVMQDDSRISEWLKEVKRIEPVSGERGTVGAVSKIYVDQGGEEMFMEETITALEPQKHMAMTFTMDFMDMDYEMHLESMDGKTKVKSNSVTTGNSFFAKSMLAFMGGSMEEQENTNLQNLKTMIENNKVDYGLN